MTDISSTFNLLVIPYGNDDSDQFMRVHFPLAASASQPLPAVVIIHGGFWKNRWNVSNAAHTTLAPSLAASGDYVAVEVEYRRRDSPGGGYPGTMDDVAASLRQLALSAEEHSLPLDIKKLVVVGHSAGGQLALWYADHAAKALSSAAASSSSSGISSSPCPVPKLVVAIAPIVDMVAAYEQKLSDEGDAVEKFMKCKPTDDEGKAVEKYHNASPQHRLPLLVPTVLVTGKGDADVPADMVAAFRDAAVEAATAESTPADDISLILCNDDADHYTPVNAESSEWAKIKAAIDAAASSWD